MSANVQRNRESGNGNAEALPSAHHVYEQASRLGNDVNMLLRTARGIVDECRVVAQDRLDRQPYATLAAAVGVGYLLGGGLPVGMVRALLGVGLRVAAERAVGELVASK